MFKFPASITPVCLHQGRPLYRIQGIEKMLSGSRHLNYANNPEAPRTFDKNGILMQPGDWLGTGTFRNSLFLEPWAQMTSVRDLHLVVELVGAVRLRITRVTRGRPSEIIEEIDLQAATRKRHVVHLGSPGDAAEASRLFWHIEARETGARVFDVHYAAGSAPRTDCRLVVLMRTFGRTTDVKALLNRFLEAGREDAFHAHVLDHVHFWVLDTTPGAETAYQDAWLSELNTHLLFGPNLGGGGNAGHLLKLFADACEASDTPPTEVLILDDDLSLSMESLARYFMFVAYRAQECLTSLPVLMKSRPTVVWEDGGFWGRLNFHEAGDFSMKRNLFPTLLKHGLQLDTFEHIDAFSPLNTCEYSTFIFFGLSVKSLKKIGYPAAFFLRGDDIEMSLRAQEAGLTMITNPNLAAWHEPAHSYGQEYMAILHGIIINLTHGDHGSDFYARFFEDRMHEHASINDAVGLRLYRDILLEILSPDSLVLTPNFHKHYLTRLKTLGATKMTRLPNADRDTLEHRAREEKTLLVPFVYPGYHGHTHKFRNIVVVNHSQHSYREVPAMSLNAKVAIMREYGELLLQLDTEFDQVRERWQQRLTESGTAEFWETIQAMHASHTQVLGHHERKVKPSDTEAATATERPVKQNARTSRIAAFVLASPTTPTQLHPAAAAAPVAAVVAATTAQADAAGPESTGHSELLADDALVNDTAQARADAAMSADMAADVVADLANLNTTLEAILSANVELDTMDSLDGPADGDLLPFDFDPDFYLALNPDVVQAGLDPVEHFRLYGREEGRRYRL